MAPDDPIAVLLAALEEQSRDAVEDAALAGSDAAPDEARAHALTSLAAFAERTARAGRLIGLAGFARWCEGLAERTRAVATLSDRERRAALAALRRWPVVAARYLVTRGRADAIDEAVGLLRALPAGAEDLAQTAAALAQPFEFPQEEPAALAELTHANLSLDVPPDVDRAVLAAMLAEAPAGAARLCELVASLGNGPASAHALPMARRIAHTVKGSASILGIRGLAILAHVLEEGLEALERPDADDGGRLTSAIGQGADCLADVIASLGGSAAPPAALEQTIGSLLEAIAARRAASGADGLMPVRGQKPALVERTAENEPPEASSIRTPIRSIDGLINAAADLEAQVARAGALAREAAALASRIGERAGVGANRGDGLSPVLRNPAASGKEARIASDSDFQEEIRSLRQTLCALGSALAVQVKSAGSLGGLALAMRMSPARTLFARLERVVRQTCRSTGKRAVLRTSGGDIRIDSELLSDLDEPLLHLLRNAVDHGIEPPDARRAAGKEERGTIEVRFERRGRLIELTCRDDGQGLDRQAIVRRARELGWRERDDDLTEADLTHLVRQPGFSTAGGVSEVSGRGVGLDAVRARVLAMRGTMEIESTPGAGCTVRIRFPASLVSQHVLIVEARGQRFAVASHTIERGIAPEVTDFTTLRGEPALRGPDGTPIPWRAFSSLGPDADASGVGPVDLVGPVLLVRVGATPLAVAFDRVLNSQEAIVRQPGRHLARLVHVTGTVTDADGRTLPVVDLTALARRASIRHTTDVMDRTVNYTLEETRASSQAPLVA